MEIKNFNQWWKINKENYEKIGVSEFAAIKIWNAALEALQNILKNELYS